MQINTTYKFKSFESIGWTEPTLNSTAKCQKWLQALDFGEKVYPEGYIDDDKPPACIFMPEKQFMEKLVKLAIKYSIKGKKVMLTKLHTVEFKKADYMVEQEHRDYSDDDDDNTHAKGYKTLIDSAKEAVLRKREEQLKNMDRKRSIHVDDD